MGTVNWFIQCEPVDCDSAPTSFSFVTINGLEATAYTAATAPALCGGVPFASEFPHATNVWSVAGLYFWVDLSQDNECAPAPTYHAYRWWTDEFGWQYGDDATACCSGTASLNPFKPFDHVQYRVVAIP